MTPPSATFRNPTGAVAVLIVGAAMWSCICGIVAAIWSMAH